jgi:hypothetical protein
MGLRPGWGFDLVAVTVNAVVYLTQALVLDAVTRRLLLATYKGGLYPMNWNPTGG